MVDKLHFILKKPVLFVHSASLKILILALLLSIGLVGCGPSEAELEAVDYSPLVRDDWDVSTPEEQGLDPQLLAELYYNASKLETIYSLLVVKDGKLIGEKYFHNGSFGQKTLIQSVTKSITSALVGIALQQGCLSSIDQKMMEFFPELADQIKDPRKNEINIRDLLQMRAGYPWEESTPELTELLFTGFRPSSLVDVPLIHDPGTEWNYSNLSSHILGIIVARACGGDLKAFAQDNLFDLIDSQAGRWIQDWDGYYLGYAELQLTARDMAKFGLMYLNDGQYQGSQVVPADWVRESLKTYSEDAWYYSVGKNVRDMGYGYQWWSVRAGDQNYIMAWGHGGQQIAILDGLDMVVVVTADPLKLQHGDGPWALEKANLNLVGNFISSLPSE